MQIINSVVKVFWDIEMPKKPVTRRMVARQRSSSTSGLTKKDVIEDRNKLSSSEDEKESNSESEVLDRSIKRKTMSSNRTNPKNSSTITLDKRETQNLVNPELQSSTQRYRTSLQRLLLLCLLGMGMFFLLSEGSPFARNGGRNSQQNRFKRPNRLQIDLNWLPSEARYALETFHDELSTPARGDRRARVLQLESAPEYANRLHQLIDEAFPQTEFYRLTKDAAWGSAELESTFLDAVDDIKPFVVIVWNSHKAPMKTLLTFAHELSADHFGAGPTRRSAGNTGFLFIGHSLPSGKACQETDLLSHDIEVLGWIHTFITRLTNYAKIC